MIHITTMIFMQKNMEVTVVWATLKTDVEEDPVHRVVPLVDPHVMKEAQITVVEDSTTADRLAHLDHHNVVDHHQ